ncbi:uncharacterized protein AB9W97_018564 [Spinachia spinachia]
MQSMDLLGKLEIYFPVKAEVKRIPLWTLPKSVIRGMGLPVSASKSAGKLTASPEGTWICPAVIRRKGQKLASHAGNHTMENLSSLLGREFRANPGPVQMSFVSANRAVYRELKDAMHGRTVLADTCHASPLPRGDAPQMYKDAVILYNGHVYLSIRNPNQNRSPPDTLRHSQSSISSTSDSPSKSLKKRRSPQTCLEPAEPLRKKVHVPLPRTAPKQLKDSLSRPDNHSTADQELLNDSRPQEKRTALRATHGKNKKPVMHKGGDVSSTTIARLGPQSTGSAHEGDIRRHRDAEEQRAAEEPAATEQVWFPPQAERRLEEDGNKEDCCECEMVTGDEEADYMHVVSASEAHNPVDIVDQSSSRSQTMTSCQGQAPASTSLHEFDYKQLENEEEIARIKLKPRQGVAALDNLP